MPEHGVLRAMSALTLLWSNIRLSVLPIITVTMPDSKPLVNDPSHGMESWSRS